LKQIVILIDNFYPAYKGGGPIQSVINLIVSLENEYNVHVITSAYDLQSPVIMKGVHPDTWNGVKLPGSSKSIRVWYARKLRPGYKSYKKLFTEINPDFVYLNGIFSYNLFMLPLAAIKNLRVKPGLVICPRGMLQKGALADKSLKKKIYLKVLKLSGLVNKAVWHATNEEEKEDILKYFVVNKGVVIAMNIPKKPVEDPMPVQKTAGDLKLIYLSLITEKKNLLFLLEVIKNIENVSLDIYGPVKDTDYWNECKKVINDISHKVIYHGDVLPLEVQDTFSRYHASILLTKGENFGHALYESLSVARPLITSNFTPWNNLEQRYAGWNLDISDIDACLKQLNIIKQLDQPEFAKYAAGSYELAMEYFIKSKDINNYRKLFSTPANDQ
jgi:glycosyltransferase involved in cell wall biosynthesis